MPARCFALSHAVEFCWMRFPPKVKHQRVCRPRVAWSAATHGIRVERYTATVARLCRTVIEPGLQLAIANERLQHRHVDRVQLQGPKIRIELLPMILVIREAPFIRELLKISHDRLLPLAYAVSI
jgi:hypothetical protein